MVKKTLSVVLLAIGLASANGAYADSNDSENPKAEFASKKRWLQAGLELMKICVAHADTPSELQECRDKFLPPLDLSKLKKARTLDQVSYYESNYYNGWK